MLVKFMTIIPKYYENFESSYMEGIDLPYSFC